MIRNEARKSDPEVANHATEEKKGHWSRLRHFVQARKRKQLREDLPDRHRGSIHYVPSNPPDGPSSLTAFRGNSSLFSASTRVEQQERQPSSTGQLLKGRSFKMAWRKKKGSDDGEFAQKAVSINAAEFVPNSDAEATTLQQRSSASEKEESEQEERKFSLQAIKNSQANATMMFSTSELDQTSPVSVISPAADDPKELGPIKRGSYREASLRWKNESTIGSHASRGKESLKVKGITAVKASSSASSSRGIFPEKDLTSDIPDGSFERRISTASPERNPASMRKVESEKMQIPYGKEQLSKTLLGAWRNGKGLSSQDSKFLVSNGLGRRSSSLPKGIEGGRGRASAEQKRISGTDFDSPWGVRAPPKEAGLSAERGSSKTFRIADFAAVVQGLKGRKNTDADGELDSLTDEEGSDQDFTSSTPVDMFRDEFVEFSMQNLQKPSKKSRLRKSTAQL